MNNETNTDIHLSRLATWFLNTIGNAIAVSFSVALVLGVFAFIAQELRIRDRVVYGARPAAA